MTHKPIDGRLWCLEKEGDHGWERDCAHNRDPETHPHRCCRHAKADRK